LCRTSLIRDEWIAALSLDLTETERFDLVRTALGAIEGPDYLAKAKEVVERTEIALRRLEQAYEDARVQLNTALTQLTETRDAAGKIGDVAAALTVLDTATELSPGDLLGRIAQARSRLTSDRLRLNHMAEAVLEGREIALLRAEIDGPAFQQRKAAAKQALERAVKRNNAALTLLAETRARLSAEQAADALAASLSSLIEHGARLGLDHDHCPLCAAPRTVEQFEEGLGRARARLDAFGSGIGAARQAFGGCWTRPLRGGRARLGQR
jgi:hypothetical protein